MIIDSYELGIRIKRYCFFMFVDDLIGYILFIIYELKKWV